MKQTNKYVRNFMYCFALCVFINALWCCSPQNRLSRLIKHHPELLKKDTVTVRDTFVVSSYKTDTTFIEKQTALHDTVFLIKNKIEIKYYKHNDTIYLSGKYKGDTLVKIIKVPYDKIVNVQKPIPTWYWVLLSILGGSFLTLLLLIIYYKNKNHV